MKKIILLLTAGALSASCIVRDSRIIVTMRKTDMNFSLSHIQLTNNQFILDGKDLDRVTKVSISDDSTTQNFFIESKSTSELKANSLTNITLAAGKVFTLLLSNAEASATFTVDFSLCNSTLNGRSFDCTITPNDKDVLAYDNTTSKWIPSSLDTLTGAWSLLSGNASRATGSVGIGTTTPTAYLDVVKTNTSTAAYHKGVSTDITISPTAASTSSLDALTASANYISANTTTGSISGIYGYASISGGGRPANMSGAIFFANTGTASGLNNVYGSRSVVSTSSGSSSKLYGSLSLIGPFGHSAANAYAHYAEISSSGFTSLTNAYGGYYKLGNSDAFASMTNAYGLYTEVLPGTGTVTNAYGLYIGVVQGSTLRYSIYANDANSPSYFRGKVGIGTNTPATKLDVVGDITTSGCLYYASSSLGTCASDRKIKKEISPFTLGLDALLGISPVNFKYNGLAGFKNDNKIQIGVVAQELEKSAPTLVTLDEAAAIKKVNYGAFTFVIINAVKEFYQKWSSADQALHSEIAELKRENQQLKERLIVIEKHLKL